MSTRWLTAWQIAIVTALSLSSARYAMAQQLGQGDDVDVSPWRTLIVLTLVLGIGITSIIVIRRRSGLPIWREPSSRRLRVIEVVRVSPGISVCLFACDDREHLVVIGPNIASALNQDGKTQL